MERNTSLRQVGSRVAIRVLPTSRDKGAIRPLSHAHETESQVYVGTVQCYLDQILQVCVVVSLWPLIRPPFPSVSNGPTRHPHGTFGIFFIIKDGLLWFSQWHEVRCDSRGPSVRRGVKIPGFDPTTSPMRREGSRLIRGKTDLAGGVHETCIVAGSVTLRQGAYREQGTDRSIAATGLPQGPRGKSCHRCHGSNWQEVTRTCVIRRLWCYLVVSNSSSAKTDSSGFS